MIRCSPAGFAEPAGAERLFQAWAAEFVLRLTATGPSGSARQVATPCEDACQRPDALTYRTVRIVATAQAVVPITRGGSAGTEQEEE